MRSFAIRVFALLVLVFVFVFAGLATRLAGQTNSAAPDAPVRIPVSAPSVVEPPMALQVTSTTNLTSEIGAAFMPPVKCDAEGNLYIRKFASGRLRGSVIKIDSHGKPTALFDRSAFAGLALNRVDAFSPAADGGIYQIAQSGVTKPRIYVLHFSSDGSPSSPSRLDADFEVYTFAAFPDGNFLVSGVQRDPMDKNDRGRSFTAVFSGDGRELATLSFPDPKEKSRKPAKAEAMTEAKSGAGAPNQQIQKEGPAARAVPQASGKSPTTIDLKDAEVSRDGNLYVMRTPTRALVDVIAPSGKIVKTLKIASPPSGGAPNSFHVSENRLALLFWNDEKQSVAIAVVDAQTGRKIAAYSGSTDLGSFACYSANEGVFTFLKHGDGNVLELIRAEAQ